MRDYGGFSLIHTFYSLPAISSFNPYEGLWGIFALPPLMNPYQIYVVSIPMRDYGGFSPGISPKILALLRQSFNPYEGLWGIFAHPYLTLISLVGLIVSIPMRDYGGFSQ